MTDGALDRLFRHDRVVVIVAMSAMTALAWAYITWLSAQMSMNIPVTGGEQDMAMPGMDMSSEMSPGVMRPVPTPWGPVEFAFMFSMWAVMMAGMMLPSVAPLVLIYARVARQAVVQQTPFASTAWFVGGYLIAWTGFSLAATGMQWGFERMLLLTPAMTSASNKFGSVVLIAAGVYQWTPLKDICLSQCQAPLFFITRHGGFRRDHFGSLLLGARHGLYCIGCCWTLMLLLFVSGIMNLLWIAAIAIFILLEKVVPSGRILSRIGGLAFVVGGIWMAY